MGLFKKLKKGIKGIRKALKLPAITLGNVAKLGAATATGGLGVGALAGSVLRSKLKSAATGGVKQMVRTGAQKALVSKIARLAPAVGASSKATARPGGAPLRTSAAVGAAERRSERKAHAAARPKRRRKPAAAAPRAKRTAPKGGKNFKALSVSWKAAGKPGRWIDWVKSH